MCVNLDKHLLIITGCIDPVRNQTHLVISDNEVRLMQYSDSIEYYIKKSPFRKIVFCDNSNYDVSKLEYLRQLSIDNNKDLEIMSFAGNIKLVEQYDNKGVGEDEIISYVTKYSKLFQKCSYITKITGRLIVTNITDILLSINPDKDYFVRDVYRRYQSTGVDTRIYMARKNTIEETLKNGYGKIKGVSKKTALEDLYQMLIKGHYSCMPFYPCFVGYSGGNGRNYDIASTSRYKLYNFLCQVGLFNVLFPFVHFFTVRFYYMLFPNKYLK